MFATFALLVWIPRLVLEPAGPVPWAGNFINLALIGAVLALGDLLAAKPGAAAATPDAPEGREKKAGR